MELTMEMLVEQARNGDPDALETLVRRIQDRIYGLALRMLWHPQDAEDAAQEILVKIVTHLGSFRNESAFTTWCYRIAGNHLLTTRKRRAESFGYTFATFEEDIEQGLAFARTQSTPEPEQDLFVKEVMIGCIQGVMLCLDRQLRLTYILSEIYEMNSSTAAEILGITPEAFRKRLSRARTLVRDFLSKNCGLVRASNPCSCSRQIPYAIKTGLVNPHRLLFAEHPRVPEREPERPDCDETDDLLRIIALLRTPEYAAPNLFVERVRVLIESGNIAMQPRH